MIKLKDINKEYYDRQKQNKIIFKKMNFEACGNDIIGIRGESGIGKSTFLNILSGMDLNYEGEYYQDNAQIIKKNMDKFRFNNIGYITQKPNLLFDRNVFDNIKLAMQARGIAKNDIKEIIDTMLEEMGIFHLKKKMPRYLSGGEAQRVSIVRALVKKPTIILADEPTAALDEMAEERVIQKFAELKKEGKQIILATHNEKIANVCDVKYMLENAQLVRY